MRNKASRGKRSRDWQRKTTLQLLKMQTAQNECRRRNLTSTFICWNCKCEFGHTERLLECAKSIGYPTPTLTHRSAEFQQKCAAIISAAQKASRGKKKKRHKAVRLGREKQHNYKHRLIRGANLCDMCHKQEMASYDEPVDRRDTPRDPQSAKTYSNIRTRWHGNLR